LHVHVSHYTSLCSEEELEEEELKEEEEEEEEPCEKRLPEPGTRYMYVQ